MIGFGSALVALGVVAYGLDRRRASVDLTKRMSVQWQDGEIHNGYGRVCFVDSGDNTTVKWKLPHSSYQGDVIQAMVDFYKELEQGNFRSGMSDSMRNGIEIISYQGARKRRNLLFLDEDSAVRRLDGVMHINITSPYGIIRKRAIPGKEGFTDVIDVKTNADISRPLGRFIGRTAANKSPEHLLEAMLRNEVFSVR